MKRLRELGLSTRAIAEQVGVSKNTVHRDLQETGVPCGTPAPLAEVPLPDRLAKVQEMKAIGKTDDEVAAELGVSRQTVHRAKCDIAEKQKEAAPKVEGTDGKKYPGKRPTLAAVGSRKTFRRNLRKVFLLPTAAAIASLI